MEQVRNIFNRGEELEYETCPKGIQVMGLMSIKEKTFTSKWGEKEGYQLTFRSKDVPNAFVSYKQSAVISARSNLGKALKKMTEGKFDNFGELTPDQAYKTLMGCLDKWYKVTVKHNPWKKSDGEEIIFANVDDNDIRPAEIDEVAPSVYFKQNTTATLPPAAASGGFEDYADADSGSDDDDDDPDWL